MQKMVFIVGHPSVSSNLRPFAHGELVKRALHLLRGLSILLPNQYANKE